MAQYAILLFFPVNFNFCRKKSATKFLSVKTSSGRVVATSFLYLTVHRWIAGDVPIQQKFVLKVIHPFRQVAQLSLTNPRVALRHDKWQNFKTVT